MNDEASGGRGRPWRAGVLAASLVSAALLAAACGGSPTSSASTESRYQQAVAYSKCMRSHGDPAWPDPGPQGAFPNNNGSLDRSSAAYKAAANACKGLAPTAGIPPAQQQQAFSQFLKYSACMRAHGIPKFPDPTQDGGGVGIQISGNIGQHTPQFKAANQACRSLQPGPGGPS
jgi:hypothetical protein